MTTTQAPSLELVIQGRAKPKTSRSCAHCSKRASRKGGLCHRHYKMWLQGYPGITPRDPVRRGKTQGKCSDCGDAAEVKGRCRKHYSRWRRNQNRPRCTLPYCEDPRDSKGRLYCAKHSQCIVPGCRERFKARRLCREHYAKLFLRPRDREEAERLLKETGVQTTLGEVWSGPGVTAPEVEEAANPYLMGADAPPLHAQAGCSPELTKDMEECLEALTMLQTKGILPETIAAKAKTKAGRIVHNRILRQEKAR